MNTTVIRYTTTPEAADENRRLIERVFAELADTRPAGLRYTSMRLADGVTFVHIAQRDEQGATLTDVAAFKDFVAGLGDRTATGPERQDATVVGSYGFTG